MDTEDLKSQISNLIDQWVAEQPAATVTFSNVRTPAEAPAEAGPKVLPEGKRVVRTKTSGDRVYLLDDVKKSRQWVTNPDVLVGTGFDMGDVVEIEDIDLVKYSMGPALFKAPEN